MAFWQKLFSGEKVKDPVCGMIVDPQTAQFQSEYQGKTYYFCSKSCLGQFEVAPRGYVGESNKEKLP